MSATVTLRGRSIRMTESVRLRFDLWVERPEVTDCSGCWFFMKFSGDAGLLPVYLSIPKRRIGWSSGGGGENPLAAFFIFGARARYRRASKAQLTRL